MPPWQRVADRLQSVGAASWVERTGYARERRYVSLNNPEGQQVRFIVVDRDHDDWSIPGALPRPLFATITPHTGRHHLVWELAHPVSTSELSRAAPMRLLAAVQHALTWHLDGDPAYANVLTKNPLHPDWRVLDLGGCPVELREFEPWLLPPEPRRRGRRRPAPRGYGRNVHLFDRTRFWAYENWAGDDADVHAVAHALNADFPEPLGFREVAGIARSVCKWMRTKWTGGRANTYDEGACYRVGLLDGSEDPRVRMSIGGVYGRQRLRAKHEDRIRAAVGTDPTISDEALAADFGLDLRTVQRIRNACDI